MNLTSVLSLLAGIGLFLYGMNLMGDGLKNAAGASLEHILEKLTNSRLKGVALGTGVTAIIQSSAATSIMCLGFVNAGVMVLKQAVPVIMGANIGSTVTGQILRLGDISNQNIFLTMLKPSSFAPLLIAFSVVCLVFIKSRNKRLNNVATILLGLGILFVGMSMMESSISPLKDDKRFQEIFFLFKNPFLGILLGAVVTAIIQSSSASVGILQAISSTGTVTWGMAIPIILGQNIGKCVTVWLGCIGTTKDAKRVAFCHLFFNVFGVLILGSVIYALQAIFDFAFWNNVLNRGNIADFHSLFNILTTVILLPFSDKLVSLSQRIIKEDKVPNENHRLDLLDDFLLKTPKVALEHARRVAVQMGYAAKENLDVVEKMLDHYDADLQDTLDENEKFLDKAESKLSDYLVKINSCNLITQDSHETSEIIRSVSDFERIGDYCVNIAQMAEYNLQNGLSFSPMCMEEIHSMMSAVRNILSITVQAFEQNDKVIASRVEPLEEVIDSIKELMSTRHIERLKNNQCSVQAGISLIEFLNSAERISDHCSNIAIHTIRKLSFEPSFDTHKYLRNVHEGVTEEYKALFCYYESIYYDPMEKLSPSPADAPAEPVEAAALEPADKDGNGKKKKHKKEKVKEKESTT